MGKKNNRDRTSQHHGDKGKNFRGRGKSQNQRLNKEREQYEDGKYSDKRVDRHDNSLNDVSWYAQYPELLAAAAQIPFPYRPGMSINAGTYSRLVPGVFVIDWVPSIGYSESVTSPASIAAKELYARVRSAFSGRLYADAPDFVVYLMALDSIYSYIGALKRVYRVVSSYTPENLTLPAGLADAIGLNYETLIEFQNDKMKLFQVVNELIRMTNKFICPATMDIFNRHYWMNDNVYTDAPTPNAQLYVYNMTRVFRYKAQPTPQSTTESPIYASGLELVPFNFSGGVNAVYAFGKGLIDALASWDDAYTISGYLTRAFEGAVAFKVDLLQFDEQLELKYVPEVLMQFENATMVPETSDTSTSASVYKTMAVSQDPTTNALLHKPSVTPLPQSADEQARCAFFTGTENLINLHEVPPTPENVTIASRMKMAGVKNADGSIRIVAGTEITVGMRIVMYNAVTDTYYQNKLPYVIVTGTESGVMMIPNVSAFDWAPVVYLGKVSGSGAAMRYTEVQPIWELHNTSVIRTVDLENIDRICVYSEFNAFRQ